MPRHWLLKTEPGCFSIADLIASPGATTMWDGVRNYQARNFLRDMHLGDTAFFYNSGGEPGIAGLVEIVREAYPDPTQWNPEDRHFDPASSSESPRWFVVDVHLTRQFSAVLPLKFLRTRPELAGMELLRKGSRLSVQPVGAEEFAAVLALAEAL